MNSENEFQLVGPGRKNETSICPVEHKGVVPFVSILILGLLVAGCLLADVICKKDASFLDLMNCSKAPSREFLFGTDNLGRDLFSCIWHGGRISILIGFASTLISTGIAVIYGTISGLATDFVDTIMMRITEIILSIPSLLLVLFLQAIFGKASVFSIILIIGVTNWCSIAKVIRTEVRQIRKSEYILAAKCSGGGFFYILFRHLGPNFISSVMFMVVMNIRQAIVMESTLSFLGMGLPLDTISWGSLLSLSNRAFMTKAWWVILIPGLFLVALLVCITNVGNWIRKSVNRKESNL